jgi:hypothetical protein
MAGTITTSTIQNDTSSPPTFRNNSVEIGTLCRAWVNFNGQGTVAIRASFNVSSITDNGTGDYTLNFTTAMPDANYSVAGTNGLSTQTGIKPITYSTGSLRINTPLTNAALYDDQFNNVQIFR